MNATVIDTLRLAVRLREAGFEAPRAEGMARALGDELAERMLTKSDLDEALRPIQAGIETMDAKFEARFDGLEPRFDAIDAKFEAKFDGLEPRFDAIDAKFEAKFDGLEPRFDAIDAKFDALDAKFDALDAKFDAKFDGLEPRFDAIDTRFDAMDAKFDAKFDSTDAKIESVHRELSGKFNLLVGMMALGFTLLVGLGGYNAFSPRFAHPAANPPEIQRDASEIPSKQSLQPVTSD